MLICVIFMWFLICGHNGDRLGVKRKTKKEKKEKKAAKDPNKPKRPATAFFIFMYVILQHWFLPFCLLFIDFYNLSQIGVAGRVSKWSSKKIILELLISLLLLWVIVFYCLYYDNFVHVCGDSFVIEIRCFYFSYWL